MVMHVRQGHRRERISSGMRRSVKWVYKQDSGFDTWGMQLALSLGIMMVLKEAGLRTQDNGWTSNKQTGQDGGALLEGVRVTCSVRLNNRVS